MTPLGTCCFFLTFATKISELGLEQERHPGSGRNTGKDTKARKL